MKEYGIPSILGVEPSRWSRAQISSESVKVSSIIESGLKGCESGGVRQS